MWGALSNRNRPAVANHDGFENDSPRRFLLLRPLERVHCIEAIEDVREVRVRCLTESATTDGRHVDDAARSRSGTVGVRVWRGHEISDLVEAGGSPTI